MTFDTSVSWNMHFNDLLGRIVDRQRTLRAVLEPEIVLTSGAQYLAEHGATSYWLAGFPAGTPDLTEGLGRTGVR